LTANVVDARHILAAKAAEVMTQAASCTGMLVVVLNQVADVFPPMRMAPGTNLLGEVTFHQTSHGVHVGQVHLRSGGGIEMLLPQQQQQPDPIIAKGRLHGFGHFVAPGLIFSPTKSGCGRLSTQKAFN